MDQFLTNAPRPFYSYSAYEDTWSPSNPVCAVKSYVIEMKTHTPHQVLWISTSSVLSFHCIEINSTNSSTLVEHPHLNKADIDRAVEIICGRFKCDINGRMARENNHIRTVDAEKYSGLYFTSGYNKEDDSPLVTGQDIDWLIDVISKDFDGDIILNKHKVKRWQEPQTELSRKIDELNSLVKHVARTTDLSLQKMSQGADY
jgi:hypothetical protein